MLSLLPEKTTHTSIYAVLQVKLLEITFIFDYFLDPHLIFQGIL